MRGVGGRKQSIIVHVHDEKCPCGGRNVVKKGQNHVHVVTEWPLCGGVGTAARQCGTHGWMGKKSSIICLPHSSTLSQLLVIFLHKVKRAKCMLYLLFMSKFVSFLSKYDFEASPFLENFVMYLYLVKSCQKTLRGNYWVHTKTFTWINLALTNKTMH